MNGDKIKPLRILHLEDNPRDAELIQLSLEADGIDCEIHRVESRAEFETALREGQYDLILSDFTLPDFDGMSALRLAHAQRPDVPFIFLSGTIGEERAVDSLKNGATDYVIKDRLSRMTMSVRRAILEAKERSLRQRAEEELRQRNELFRQITENVDDLVAVLDPEGRHVFCSPSYQRLLGDAAALIGADSFGYVHPQDRERIRRSFRETVASGRGQRVEFRFLLQDGAVRQIESQYSAIRDEKGTVSSLVSVSRDITQRKQAEMKIREQAALLDQAQDAIFVRDLDQRITYWNRAAERVYGWAAEEVIGKRASELLYRPDAPHREEIWKTVLERGDWTGEVTQVTKRGNEINVSSRRTLLRDSAGQPVAILNINTDITEKKLLEVQFLRSQRLENIGALAGGIAHDLNNVLSPVLMVSDLMLRETTDATTRRMLETVKGSALRGSQMVKQILQFAQGARGERMVLSPKHLIKDMSALAKDTFPKDVQIETEVARDVRQVHGDATQLHQVLLNLCVNARDAMPQGGTLSIQAQNVDLRQKPFPCSEQSISGPYVLVSVSDTGTGMAPELLDKIFQPFFTTKADGHGTGLGLSTLASIVKSHQGYVEVFSELGKGTTFTVYLPAARQEQGAAPGETIVELPAGQGEWILMADDELAVLEMTKEMAEAYHYNVLTASSGEEAIRLFEANRGKIAAVVTDLMMPAMDGGVLIRSLREMAPDVKIICVSGSSSETKLSEEDVACVKAVLHKPYTAEEFLIGLRQAITAR